TRGGSSFTWRGCAVRFQLPGMYNVSNALAAATAAHALGVPVETIGAALSSFAPVAGHGEQIDAGQPFSVVVDFAHTGGPITAVLRDARSAIATDARVIVVFGAGGDRDRSRRA